MNLESVRELKAALIESVIVPLSTSVVTRAALGVAAQPMSATGNIPPTIALGVMRKGKTEYALAIRVQKRGLENSQQLDTIRKQAKGEVDVRYIGQVAKRPAERVTVQQKHTRPLKIGVSIGHFKITAGTLGAFVRDPGDGAMMVLSNNHVLANENGAKKGDVILQPGPFDRGRNPEDRIGTLTRFVRLKKTGANLVDIAVATVDPEVQFDRRTLTGLNGKLAGVGDPMLDDWVAVGKVGRTTGTTKGRVVTFELDNLLVSYDMGTIRFDHQIEIEGEGDRPFSQGGDSGSLIVDADRRAVALLFAGSDHGGANDQGLTYANPIGTVLATLKTELIFT